MAAPSVRSARPSHVKPPFLPGYIGSQQAELIPLTANATLVGHDSWADGRLGDFFAPRSR
jgi:hypothetical protein